MMPDLGGLDAAAEVNRGRRVPVLLVSARCDAEALARAAGDHIVGCLAKPVQGADLEAAVARAVDRPEQGREGAGPGQEPGAAG